MIELTKIKIKTEIADRIDERIEETKFESKEEYVNIVLEEIVCNQSHESKNRGYPDSDRNVDQHLEDLGYK